jgi:hypothetical protein
MNRILRVLCCILFAFPVSIFAGTEQAGTNQQASAPTADKTIRVYVTDSQSWEVRGGWGASGGTGGGSTAGGARPQTAEIIKTFGERCPELTVTNNRDKANYAVILDHEGGKGLATHHNKIAVFNRDGDSIFSHSTVSLGNSVKDACEAIRNDVQKHPQSLVIAVAPAAAPAPVSSKASAAVEDATGTLSISSAPDGADIYADDEFVGNAPANLKLKAGKHSIRVKVNGYKDWFRDLTVHAGSEMRLIAKLDQLSIAAESGGEAKQFSVGADTTASSKSDESREKTLIADSQNPVTPPTSGRTVSAGTPNRLDTASFASDPSGAEVYVDDSFIGKTPVAMNIKPGQHNVRMVAKDCKNWSQQIMIVRGSELNLSAKLEKTN